MRRANPMAVLKTESKPTNICGHSDCMYFTDQTKRNPPRTMSINPPILIFQLFTISSHCSFSFAVDQYQVANVDNTSQALPDNEYGVLSVNRIA